MRISSLRGLATVCGLLGCLMSAQAETQVRYVGPGGSLDASGLRPTDAIGDLQAAVDSGLRAAAADDGVEIRVLHGTYVGQRVVLRSPAPGGTGLAIVGDSRKGRPVFDGAGLDGPWLTVSTESGPYRGLRVQGLEVRNYATAITLNGSRDLDSRSVSQVDIRDNHFVTIGQTAMTQKAPSTAAVRLVNADKVQIVNNRFQDVRNRWTCGIIHSLYLAHGSTDNRIEGNSFMDSCGDAVRFRDQSNNNLVENNTFIDAWADAPISDWYCDKSNRSDCTKKTPECPSFGNVLARNKVEARKSKAPKLPIAHGDDATQWCPALAASQSATRTRFVER